MKDANQSLGNFLPLSLLSRIHGKAGARPAAVEFPAAVLFVDVSRYTALVEQLARRGQEGLEKISTLLSLSYGRCADQICNRSGEVLYFEGDSLVAYWPADGDNLGSAVRAAVDCADAICGPAAQNVRTGETDPALHVGVGAGRLWAAALGGQPVWNLVAGGDALMQAAASQTLARPREYVVSDAAAQELANFQMRAPVNTSGRHSELLPLPSASWLSSFLPPQLREVTLGEASIPERLGVSLGSEGREIEGLLGAIHEMRPVSALFARISGLDLRTPNSLSRLHALCTSLQEILQVRGGPSGELYVDEKGLIFNSVFGSRGSFHRDDPLRAVDSACAMDQLIASEGFSASIGVATGHALFCMVGSARRRQLMVHGAPVNRAARLMTALASGVACDAPTERATRSSLHFEQRGTLQLIGLGDVAPVFRPLGRRSTTTGGSLSLIGRTNELAVLKQAFEETCIGGTRLLAVLGEPGIGKTALVTAFTEKLRMDGTEVAIARAQREDRRTSLLPWRRVLVSLLGLPPDCDGFSVLEAVRSRVQGIPDIEKRLPLLGGVLGISVPENEGTRHLEGPHRGDATMRLLGDLVGALAPRPLVLVLEDSQWLDSASWRLIEWILGSHSSLLLIVCVRLEEIPEELKSLRRRAEAARLNATRREADDPARFCRILDLEELGEKSIRELVSRTLPGGPPHPELAERISALADGNPFFAEEIAIALRSEGLIAIRDGFWRPLRPLEDLRYFEGVERVIRERVDLLDISSFKVLKAAAVVGRSFNLRSLGVLLDDERGETIAGAIEKLLDLHLVRRGEGPTEYEFRHDQIRDVVYSLISVEVRQHLHGRLANWIESNQSATAVLETAGLVQHFEAAGDIKKAVKYADLAATRALQVGAFREVEDFVGICLSHETRQLPRAVEEKLQAVRWRRQLAEAHYGRGDIHAQGLAVRRALAVAGQPVPRSAITTVVRLMGRGLRLGMQQVLPPSSKRRHPVLRDWERELARCYNQAATVDYFELRYARGMCNLIGAVVHAEQVGPSVELAVASCQLGCGLSFLGWQAACNYFIARAEQVAVALADPTVHSHVCILDALWRIGRCDWSMVDQRLNESQELSTRAGDQLDWCNAQGMRFWSLYYRGDLSALEQTALALLSRAQNAGNIQQEIWALRCKALCVLYTDRPREAVDILRLITSAMLGSVDLAAQISAKGALALALARVGLHAESVETVTETLRLLREQRRPTSHSTLVGISGVAEVLLRGREAGLAREYDQWPYWEQQALSELRRYSRVFPLGLAQCGLWTGLSLWLNGQTDKALAAWTQALAIARRFSLRQDESMIAAEMRRRQSRG